MRQFNHLNVPYHWHKYWSKYPEGMTILESLFQWVDQVDKMVDELNKTTKTVDEFKAEYNKKFEDFIEQFDKNLQSQITIMLTYWLENGTLADIINQDVFNMKANTLDMNKITRLNTQFEDIQTAINQTAAQNEKLTIVSGTYSLPSISFPDNSQIDFLGTVTFLCNTPLTNKFAMVTGSNVVFKGHVVFDGNGNCSKGLTHEIGTKGFESERIDIKNVHSETIQARGHFIQEECEDLTFDDMNIVGVYAKPNGVITDDSGSSKGVSITSLNGMDTIVPKNIHYKKLWIENVETIEDGDGFYAGFRNGKMNLLVDHLTLKNNAKRGIKMQSNGATFKKIVIIEDKVADETTAMRQCISPYGSALRFEDVELQVRHLNAFADFSNSIADYCEDVYFGSIHGTIDHLYSLYGFMYSVTSKLKNLTVKNVDVKIGQQHFVSTDTSLILLRGYCQGFTLTDINFEGDISQGILIQSTSAENISEGVINNIKMKGVRGYLVNVMSNPNIYDISVDNVTGSNTSNAFNGQDLVNKINANVWFGENTPSVYKVLPTPNKKWRGRFIPLAATSASYNDDIYVCTHKAGTSLSESTIEFEWKKLSLV